MWRGAELCVVYVFLKCDRRPTVLWSTTSEPGRFAGDSARGEGGGLDECRWLGKSKNSSGWGRLTRPARRPDAMPAHHQTPGLGLRLMETDGRHMGGRNGHGPSNVFMFSDAMLMPREGAILDEREREMEKPEPASPIDPRTSCQRPIYYTTMSAKRPRARPSRPLSISASPSPKTCSNSKPPSTSLFWLAARQTVPNAQS